MSEKIKNELLHENRFIEWLIFTSLSKLTDVDFDRGLQQKELHPNDYEIVFKINGVDTPFLEND